ncbi:Homocysteine S-methyltransferase [Cubamyces sp. BRFM 1775]|nr:Homocysteine S-methyltransferase [Cubamyces sp. BRFM 1775]
MSELTMANKPQVLVLDGGLGTTLEDVFHKDISHALWSAKPIDEDPEVIIAAHLAFLRARANIILTSTYQCAYTTFERAGYTRQDAERIMLKAVELATEARRRFLDEARQENHRSESSATSPPLPDVKIALSLGPFGATLYPAQEFDGIYPPPYGPNLSSTQTKTNAFEDTLEGQAQEQAAMDALTEFHYERLCIFAENREAWDAIDFVAFETVPLRREVYAIRRAMAHARRLQMKPWWISNDYPDGHFPEAKREGEHLTAADVAKAVLHEDVGAAVWGMGINCTGLKFLPELLKEARKAAKGYLGRYGRRPWLVLYPNRGDVYIPETQSWRKMGKEGSQWAKELCMVVQEGMRSGDWEGCIAGGCCKTGPEEIAGLVKELHTWL